MAQRPGLLERELGIIIRKDGPMKIESRIGKSTSSDRQIYAFITDFNNFRDFLPEGKVTGWEATAERCSFHVEPIGRTGLQIVEKEPSSLVKIASVPELSSYQFTLWIQLKRVDENDTRVRITLEPQVNPFLLSIIGPQLQNLVDGLVERVESFPFQP